MKLFVLTNTPLAATWTAALVLTGLVAWGGRAAARRLAEIDPPLWGLGLVMGSVSLSALWLAAPANLPWVLPLGWGLGLLAVIDLMAYRLPDLLTAPLGVLGLAAGIAGEGGSSLVERLAGAAGGGLALLLVAGLYRAVRGRSGLGLGDVKLMAVAGAWLGWQPLPVVLVAAAAGGAGMALVRMARRQPDALAAPLPFGAPLAAAIWCVLLFEQLATPG